MSYLYNLILYQPLLNALIFFYQTIAFKDLGLAIIFLTVLIRLVLFPIFHKSAEHQMIMQQLQPKLKKIQEEHKHDKERQVKATMELYKNHKINPFSGFFLLLVQLPVLIALYQIFFNISKPEAFVGKFYSFIEAPANLGTIFLGLINLNERSILMVVLAAIAQYFQGKLALPKNQSEGEDKAAKLGRQMVIVGPIITLVIFVNLPSAVSLYWLTTSIFSIFQQILINRKLNGKPGNIHQKTAGTHGF